MRPHSARHFERRVGNSAWQHPLRRLAVVWAMAAALSLNALGATNILSNPGFEAGNLNGWTTFGPNNYVQTSVPHSGSYDYKVYGQFNGSYNYTGIYQDSPSAPGATYSAGGWAYSLSSDGGGIHGQDLIWIEVSFRDAAYNALALYRSAVVNGANIADYGGLDTWFDLEVTNQCAFTNGSALILSPGNVIQTVTNLVAPAGTAYVRYQTVFAQGPDNANGSMYFDDLVLNQTDGTIIAPPARQWNIVWDDEFDGTTVDPSHWTFETGNNNGWGNSELEYYTSRPQNAYVGNGLLHISARQESYSGYSFTSARMKTQNHYTRTYGRIEWRAAVPAGVGMWPALWLLGANITSVGWPACGEIDVMEANGSMTGKIQSSLHSGSSETGYYYFPGGESANGFHTYMVDWQPGSISFSVDGNVFETQNSWSSSIGPYPAPFNAPFFLIMNLAVGGNYVGNPSVAEIEAGTTFPAEMLVDYVRVYEETAPLAISVAPQANGNLLLSWPTNIVCRLQTLTSPAGLSPETAWVDVTNASDPFVVTPGSNAGNAFYRLVSP